MNLAFIQGTWGRPLPLELFLLVLDRRVDRRVALSAYLLVQAPLKRVRVLLEASCSSQAEAKDL